MSANIISATIFIKENTRLPSGLALESEAYLPGWRAVQKLDGHAVAYRIERSEWNFFFLAGAIHTTVLGGKGPGTLRRAVQSLLAKRPGKNYNSLQITRVVSRRFFGIPFASVSAHSRHIQEGMYLVPAKDFRMRQAAAAPLAAVPSRGSHEDEMAHPESTSTTPHEAMISNS
ncbi:MAG: hypothetical protein WA736_04130 [Candidatus Acidiferrum sp.]